MNIGISTACFYPEVLTEECLHLVKSLGFDLVEIFLNSPTEYTEEFISKLVEIKNDEGIKVNSVHAFCATFEPFLFDKYERRRKDMMACYKKICKAAKMLDAPSYTFHGMRKLEMNSIPKKLIIEVYNELVYTALENGINLSQENVSWCMSSDLSFLEFLKENVKYPLKFTFDIKQAYKAGINPKEYIDIMGKDLINFHINDRDEDRVCLLPGKGTVDFKNIFYELKKIGYNGNAILEVYNDNYSTYNDIVSSKNYLKSLA